MSKKLLILVAILCISSLVGGYYLGFARKSSGTVVTSKQVAETTPSTPPASAEVKTLQPSIETKPVLTLVDFKTTNESETDTLVTKSKKLLGDDVAAGKIRIPKKELLQTKQDVDALELFTGDESLRVVILAKLTELNCDFKTVETGGVRISYIAKHVARGGVSCEGGGYGVFWGYTGANKWEELGFQSLQDCERILKLGVPFEFAPTCFVLDSAGKEIIKQNPIYL